MLASASHRTALMGLVYSACQHLSPLEGGQKFRPVQSRSCIPVLWLIFLGIRYLHPTYDAFYPVSRQSISGRSGYSAERAMVPEVFHRLPERRSLLRVCALREKLSPNIKNFRVISSLYKLRRLLATAAPRQTRLSVTPIFSSRLLPAFIDRGLLTTMDSSATSLHFVSLSSFLLKFACRADNKGR